MRENQTLTAALAAAFLLAGCARKPPTLPDDMVEKAATCAVVAAATERGEAGAKGNLSADAQARIFHYALLAGANDDGFDDAKAQAVFQREPKLFDATIKGEWRVLQPACTAAFPPTRVTKPALPDKPLDSELQCYVLVDFLRKAFGSLGGTFGETSTQDGVLADRLDAKVSPSLAKAGVGSGAALQAKRAEALAAAAKLGQPPAVVAACRARYGA